MSAIYQSEQHIEAIFPYQLFNELLKLMSTSESEIRLIVLEILQLIIDRQHYADRLCKIRLILGVSI